MRATHKITGSSPVCPFFKQGRNGMYASVPVCTSTYQYVLVYTWLNFVYISMYRYILVCTDMYYVLVYTSMYKYIPVYTGMYSYILVYPCLWKPYYQVANALVQGSTDHFSNVML